MCPLVRNSERMEKFHILQRNVPSQTLPIAGRLAQKRPRRLTAGAECRAGELLALSKEQGERDPGGHGPKVGSHPVTQLPKLADLGITKMQSSRWQRLAGMSADDFEEKVERATRKAVSAVNGTSKRERAICFSNKIADRQTRYGVRLLIIIYPLPS
jgi:hypothetical protein